MKARDVAWDEELANLQKSGLSQAEYCRRRHNVSPKGFCAYRLMKSRAEPGKRRATRAPESGRGPGSPRTQHSLYAGLLPLFLNTRKSR